MRFLRRSLTGLFLLSVTIGLLAVAGKTMFDAIQIRLAQSSETRPQRERVVAVNVLTVEAQDIAPVLRAFGEVRARRTLDLRSSAAGQLIELADGFEEGGRVGAGQLLARIDPANAESALLVAKTDLDEAEAEVREAENALDIAGDDLSSAEEQAKLRDAALARAVDLRDRGVGTAAAVETAELAASSGKQAVLSRRQALANAQAAVDRATTTLARKQIALAEAQRSLDDTRIYADFAGTLSAVTAVKGGLVTNNEKIAEIIDTDALEVSFRISTPEYARLLGPGGALIKTDVTATLDVMGVNLESHGRITRESAAVGEGQTGRLLFAQIDEARGFRPGDFVSVAITEPVLSNVALLPAAALGSDNTVLVVGEDERLSAVAATLLRRQDDRVIVSAVGLAGATVVAERTPLLGAGIKVRPVRPQPEEVAAAAETEVASAEPDLVELTDERRAKLVAFVEGSDFMPKDVKERLLTQLKEAKVPAQMVERIESRMGG